MTERKWCFMDMVTDAATGRLSESKIWANIGKGVMCWVLIAESIGGNPTEVLLMWFGIIVLGHELGARFLTNKHAAAQQAIPSTEPPK